VTQNNSLSIRIEDVDKAKAATDFSLSQMVYNAALKSRPWQYNLLVEITYDTGVRSTGTFCLLTM